MKPTYTVRRNRRRAFFWLWCAALLLFQWDLSALDQAQFQRITIADGLSQNTVFAIVQDRKGFLWFGTEDGLNRYDGYTFKIYKHEPEDPDSLGHNRVQVLYVDMLGVLWVGTKGGGVNRYNPENDSFTCFKHEPDVPGSLSDNTVRTIYEDDNGTMWLGTNNGLERFNRESETFECFRDLSWEAGSYSDIKVSVVGPQWGNRLVVATMEKGLSLFDMTGERFYDYSFSAAAGDDPERDKINSAIHDGNGHLWLAAAKGVHCFNLEKATYLHRHAPHPIQKVLNTQEVVAVLRDSTETIWFGTYGSGLYNWNSRTGMICHYRQQFNSPNSLSNDCIQCIYEDGQGILWIGTDSGLNKYDRRKRQFGKFRLKTKSYNGVPTGSIWALHKDTRKKHLWVGTDKGLYIFDCHAHKCKPLPMPRTQAQRLQTLKIYSLLEDRDGSLWIGSDGSGVLRLAGEKNHLTHFRSDKADPHSISSDTVLWLYEDRQGRLWLGTAAGLNRFNRADQTFIAFRHDKRNPRSISDGSVNYILEDSTGGFWIATHGGGLDKMDRNSATFIHHRNIPEQTNTLSNNTVSCLLEGDKGTLWIGTSGGGLNKLDIRTNTFTHFYEKHGLPNSYISGMLRDKSGNIWLSTNKGISKFNPGRETFKNYDFRDGLQSNEFNTGAFFKSRDGYFFFGGINGFNAFEPHAIKPNSHIPEIVITEFRILNEPVTPGKHSILKKVITETDTIRLSHKHYLFSFDFAALDYSIPGKNRYAYKMEGFDTDWFYRDAQRRYATYTNLDPGTYTFRVKGSNNDGKWNETGAAITIIIAPPFWRTWWFSVLALVSFAALSYLLINFIKKYITLAGFWRREKYIGKYKLIDKIGAGGMGTIYTARDTTVKGATVAIKVLRDELFDQPTYRKRFIQEAAIIDNLDHPNIIRVIERGQHKQKLYIVMELLKGITLSDKIENESPLAVRTVIEIALQVNDALKKIHSRNIVHRDLKPDNIVLVRTEGNLNFVKLLDFGLAKMQFQSRITQTGAVMGTINYMAPEQVARGAFSPASDIYSLGAIFYESLTNRKLFTGERVTDIMRRILEQIPEAPILIRPDIPRDLNLLVMQMLEKEPGHRPSVDEITLALRKIYDSI